MPSVGLGVQDIRIHTGTEHRVLYVAKFVEAVYILHAFEKRTRRTAKDDLDVARHRMRLLLNQRARRTGYGGNHGEGEADPIEWERLP